ncbi:MAG: ABC transporter permease [Pseudomonadota bacterium]
MSAPTGLRTAMVVLRKEIVDALRETRTLLVVLASALLVGPTAAVFILTGVDDAAAERRDIVVSGIAYAPSLKNYLERQTYTIRTAPADFEAQLRAATTSDPVVVVPRGFEAALAQGDSPLLEVVSGGTGRDAGADVSRIQGVLDGFVRERVAISFALRGLSPELLQPVVLQNRPLAKPQTTAATFARILPFLVIIAVLYGALNAALDTMAGERERGSLEPLLTNPSHSWALVLGKWGAVAGVAMLVAVLCCLSLMLTQWLTPGPRLQTLLSFGPQEALSTVLILVPFAAALSAVLMAVAIRCKTFKEAQASSNLIVLVLSMLPVYSIFNGGDADWQLWVPGLAQNVLIGRIFGGEGFSAQQFLVPLVAGAALTAAGIVFIARSLREAATK